MDFVFSISHHYALSQQHHGTFGCTIRRWESDGHQRADPGGSIGFTSVDFLAYQAHNTGGIDDPASMTACVGLLAQGLATGIFAAKKDASTINVPMPSSAMDCSG